MLGDRRLHGARASIGRNIGWTCGRCLLVRRNPLSDAGRPSAVRGGQPSRACAQTSDVPATSCSDAPTRRAAGLDHARRACSQKRSDSPPAGWDFSAGCTGWCPARRDAYRGQCVSYAASTAKTTVETAVSGAGCIRASCGGWLRDRVASARCRRNAFAGAGCQSARK
jgi:hypothetical protein